MNSKLLLATFSLLAVNGCASNTSDDGKVAASVEEISVAPVLWCMLPSDHHLNGIDEVWTVDISSTFVHPHDRFISRRSGFYSHGDFVGLADAPMAGSWLTQGASQIDGYHTTGISETSSVTLDLTGESAGHDLSGTIRVARPGQEDEVVDLVHGGFCP